MSDFMQKIKPDYKPLKGYTLSIEEHKNVERKNRGKGRIASTTRRQPVESYGC